MDLALQMSLLGVKTLHSTAEVPDNMTIDKGIRVRAGGGCACRYASAGETLSANRLNGHFQSWLRSLYILWCDAKRLL